MKESWARRIGRSIAMIAILLLATGCEERSMADLELPNADSTAAWFGDDAKVRLDGNVLEITGNLPPGFIERGGVIWQRSGPYFYLFNVNIRDIFRDYPDLAAVRAIVLGEDGREIARATLHRGVLNEITWDHGVRLASRAQQEGTDNPRRIEQLIEWAEERTEYSYSD